MSVQEQSQPIRHRRPGLAALAAVIVAFTMGHTARGSDGPLLSELPAAEGQEIIAPYELWIATFAQDEGSYGSGPRILVITNDRKMAVAYVNGNRTELEHVGELVLECKPAGSMAEAYEAGNVTLKTSLTTSPGEEACWVEGTISVTVGDSTETYRVKGASGL